MRSFKSKFVLALAVASIAGAAASADSTVTVDSSTLTLGYMNVFNLPSAGGAFQFGSPWGVGDLSSSFSGSVCTLTPNSIGDPNGYWYIGGGGPGAVGNKVMEANLYAETTGTYVGTNLTFAGNVLSNTLSGTSVAGNGVVWTSVAFIKDFAPDYSSFNLITAPLNAGAFSITLATVNDPARHVQWGFQTIGSDVWATDLGNYGSIVVGPATGIPEPTGMSLLGLAAAGLMGRRRK